MKKISELTNDWSSTFILAHEVGHHINGHTRDFLLASILDDITLEKKRQEELEADEFASFVLTKLGASYDEIKEVIELVTTNDDDTYSTHPTKNKRLLAVNTGYNRARKNSNINTRINNNQTLTKKEIKINSNWSASYSSLRNKSGVSEKYNREYTVDDYIYKSEKEGKSIDPFRLKELEQLYPISYKSVIANGKTSNKSEKNEIILEISEKKYKYEKIFTMLEFTEMSDLYIKYFPNTTYAINIFNLWEQPKVQVYDSSTSQEYLLDTNEYPRVNRAILYKFEYIVDDIESGWLPAYSEGFFKNSNLTGENITPASVNIFSSASVDDLDDNSKEKVLKELVKFFKAIKKGKKLFVRIGREKYDFVKYDWESNYDFETYTYTFDLTGSSKALNF